MKQIILNFSGENSSADEPRVIEITEDTQILGIFVGIERQKVQMRLRVVHKKPGIQSLTLVKAVLFERSKFDFTGELVIEKGAELTDTYLRCDVLMMSQDASARAVPCLEISETNVKGGHGATVGMVNSDQLFMCMSRGISKQAAQAALAEAFVRQVADMVGVEEAADTAGKAGGFDTADMVSAMWKDAPGGANGITVELAKLEQV